MHSRVVRFDAPGEVLSVEVAPDGSVRATADVSRCGIYVYQRADGTSRRELVLPEHLFNPDSLKTLASVAVTAWPPSGHPPELLNPDNARKYAAGHVHETIDAVEAPSEQDFGYVRVRLTGRTKEAVEKLQQSRLYTSPAYTLPQYDATPGVHPVWGPYDAIQGPRVYNHLALTDSPRGGSAMQVHLDSADADLAVQQSRQDPASWVEDEPLWEKAKAAARKQGKETDFAYITGIYKQMGGGIKKDAREDAMIKIRLDGIGKEVELPELAAEYVAQALARKDAEAKSVFDQYEAMKADMAVKQKEMDGLKAKMDEAMGMMERLRGEKQAAEEKACMDAKRADAAEARLADPAQLRQILAPRVALETVALGTLPKDQHSRIDAMGDEDIRKAVVSTLLPAVKLDGISGERLAGLYEGALATRQPRKDSRPPAADPQAPAPQAQHKTMAEAHKARVDAEYQAPHRGSAR